MANVLDQENSKAALPSSGALMTIERDRIIRQLN
jgi:hypothetical protein